MSTTIESPEDFTDEALMEAYLRGDERAHRMLFARLAPPVRTVARQALREPADVDEVVQLTFLQVHRARHDFRSGARVRPWIYAIARNITRDALRKKARARETELVIDGWRDPAFEPALPGAERELRARVRVAIAKLSTTQRRAVELHWLEERPFAEVAEIEGTTENAVKVRAHRAYRALRDIFEQDETIPALLA